MNVKEMTTGQLKYAFTNWDLKNPKRKHAVEELERRTNGIKWSDFEAIKEERV